MYSLGTTIRNSRVGEKKKWKTKTGKGKNWKLTHFWREIAFFHFPYFDIFLYPILWIFVLVPVYVFFFSLFSCCPRDFWHGFYLVGILWVFFTLFFCFFFVLVLVRLFRPSFSVARGISPLFLGFRHFCGISSPYVCIYFIYRFLSLLRFFFSSFIFVLLEGFWTLFLFCRHILGFLSLFIYFFSFPSFWAAREIFPPFF